MRYLSLLRNATFAGLLTVTSAAAFAQGIITGGINGTVADPTGAVIPNASITAFQATTNAKYTAVSKADGSFSLNNMAVGIYTVTITENGFSSKVLENVEVSGNRTADLGLEKLEAGAATETVEVSAAQNMLETTNAQVTTTFDSEQLSNLPVAGGFDELALLIPGVVNTHGNNFSNTNGVGFSVNGQRGRSNNFELDGQANNDNSVAGPQAFFGNEEALAEVQIITNNFGAEYGRNMGSVVNYLTKSGTNSIHGSGIYKYSGDFTSSNATGVSKGPQFGFCAPGQTPQADGCEAVVVPRYVLNVFGGTIGFPILKDKLFGFGSTYFYRFFEFGGLSASGGNSLFPTPAGLTALEAAFPNSPAIGTLNALNPYKVALGNPRQLGTATNQTVTDGVTSVSIPFSQFGRQIPVADTDQEDLGRIDYQITPKDRLFLRYFYQKNPDSPDNPNAYGGVVNVRDAVHSVGADIKHTFNARWLDQLRYSFQQSTIAFDGGGFSSCTITSFQNCPSSISLGAGYTALGLANNLPQGRIVKVGQVQNNATWSVGRHNITFGGEFDYENSPNVFLPNASGTFSYPNFNAFIQGGCSVGCTLSLTAGNPTTPFKEKDVAAYFQDDWKVTSDLTLNLGMRWEFFGQAINLLHNETVAQQEGPAPFWSTALPLSATTFPSVAQVYHYFEPRVGFAWNPAFDKRFVLRGGYDINIDPGFYNINLNSATSAPVVNAGSVVCTVSANCLPTGGATYGNVASADLKFIPTGGNPGERNQTLVPSNFRQPYGQTYTLGLEYQVRNAAVIEARYTGNHVVGNFQTLDGNPYLAPVAADFPNVVSPSSLCTAATSTLGNGADIGHEYCGTTNVRVRANTSFSIYNSLQTKLTTRSYHGLTADLAYTWSRTIDNSSEIFGTFGAGNTEAFAQNPLDSNVGERAVSGDSYPNVSSLGLTYVFPKFTHTSSLVSKLTNGWQANTIWLYNSGQPYTDYDLYINESAFDNYPNDQNSFLSYSNYKESSAFGSSVDFGRPIVSNKSAPVTQVGLYTKAYACTTSSSGICTGNAVQLVNYATGVPTTPDAVHFISNNRYAAQLANNPFPGAGRNILRGNTYNNVDFSVFKNTKMTERITFRLEVDAYNVLNRSYYGTPDNYIGDAGSSFNTFLYNGASGSNIGFGTGLRNLEFAGKILF
jgi:hypothetical protein